MKKRFRTIVLVLSLALLTAVFASCGGPASPSAAPSSGAISMAVDNSMDAAENNFKPVRSAQPDESGNKVHAAIIRDRPR